MTQLNLSARAYHRILELARTIAVLAGSEDFQSVPWRQLGKANTFHPFLAAVDYSGFYS